MYNEKVLIGLSGGINSMAVLCWLSEQEQKPKEVHLFYAHFLEHSPDTFQFVADGIRFAKKHFEKVVVKITKNSIIDFFKEGKIIPHPMVSPCSRKLKIEPINAYCLENDIKVDLVGYVKHELKKRASRQQQNIQSNLFGVEKIYPIGKFTDEWCFEIVKKHIGWWPKIYDIVDESGRRVFKHNNCLPCKNMNTKNFDAVAKHYPKYWQKAIELSSYLGSYWGRDKQGFYTTFGKDLGQEETCESCKF